jgi:hypothetical protein
MYKDNIIGFLITIIMFGFFACSKSEKQQTKKISDVENLSNFVIHSKIIRDSIKKLKSDNWEFIICTQRKIKNNTIIKLTPPCDTFYIQHEYYYKSIDGLNIIFYDYSKPLTNKNVQKGLENLIRKKVVKIEKSDMACCQMPFFYFAFCNENPEIISCFDYKMMRVREAQYLIEHNKSIRNLESSFYPKCN